MYWVYSGRSHSYKDLIARQPWGFAESRCFRPWQASLTPWTQCFLKADGHSLQEQWQEPRVPSHWSHNQTSYKPDVCFNNTLTCDHSFCLTRCKERTQHWKPALWHPVCQRFHMWPWISHLNVLIPISIACGAWDKWISIRTRFLNSIRWINTETIKSSRDHTSAD